jgi:multisubunit Na+/H+ antiporter MnhC subunit
MAFSVQTFLAWRLYKVTHSLVLTALVCAGAVTAFGERFICARAQTQR